MEQRRDVAYEECAWMQIHRTVEDKTAQSAQQANTDPPSVRVYCLNSH